MVSIATANTVATVLDGIRKSTQVAHDGASLAARAAIALRGDFPCRVCRSTAAPMRAISTVAGAFTQGRSRLLRAISFVLTPEAQIGTPINSAVSVWFTTSNLHYELRSSGKSAERR